MIEESDMPMTDEEKKKKRREYHKEYRRKHPEKIREIEKRYKENHREEYKRRQRKYEGERRRKYPEKAILSALKQNQKMREKINMILGKKCIICNFESEEGQKNLICHEIYGREHERGYYYILNHIDDFVRICKFCHRAIHIVAKINFEKAIELINKMRENKS